MIRSRIDVLAVVLAACSDAPLVPDDPKASLQPSLVDQELAQALASAAPAERLEVIATFDAATTAGDVLQAAILDLGAGTGWLSHRLARLGHYPCAVDLTIDRRDGLGAARHYTPDWPLVQSDFAHLPLGAAQVDMVVYNASLHYSIDYRTTLREAHPLPKKMLIR